MDAPLWPPSSSEANRTGFRQPRKRRQPPIIKRQEELHPRDSGKGVNVVLHGDLPQIPALSNGSQRARSSGIALRDRQSRPRDAPRGFLFLRLGSVKGPVVQSGRTQGASSPISNLQSL